MSLMGTGPAIVVPKSGAAVDGAMIRNPGGTQTPQLSGGNGGYTWPQTVYDTGGDVQAYGASTKYVYDPNATVFRASRSGIYFVWLGITMIGGSSSQNNPPLLALQTEATPQWDILSFILPYVSPFNGPGGEISGTFSWQGILDPSDSNYGAVIGLWTSLSYYTSSGANTLDTLYGQCAMTIQRLGDRP